MNEPVVTVEMRSPKLCDRSVTLDFKNHSMTFEEMLHQGITEENYRDKWAEHLVRQGIKPEAAAAHVKQLEEYYLRMVP